MADDFLEFLPLFPDDDEDAILARMREWANEGLDPEADADSWVDTREGSHWHVCVMPGVRELARLYDLAGSEVPASGFPLWAWGEYLDDHANVQDIERLPATVAQGEVTFTGDEGTLIAAGVVVGVEPASPDDDAPEYEVTEAGTIDASGSITLPIQARETGISGNVGAGAVTVLSTPLSAIEVTNAEAIIGGSEPETDDALRERVIASYRGQGAGNKRDYERWARAWAGVGRATIIPLWAGPGTVKVIVADADGNPLPDAVLEGLQNDLDPNPGRADGEAPVGAHVTVATAVARPLDIEGTVEFEDGYSLDGFGGTIALRADIMRSLRDYVERVESGGEVVAAQISGRVVTVGGVHDFRLDSLDGVAPPVNVAIASNPAEAPQLGTVTLVEGAV